MRLFVPADELRGVRSRPTAQHVAMAVAAVWLAVFGLLHVTTGITVFSLFSVAPLIVATVADTRRTAIFAAAAVALTIVTGWWQGTTTDAEYWTRVGVVCIICGRRSQWQRCAAAVRSGWRG